jgi:hypothetical protein
MEDLHRPQSRSVWPGIISSGIIILEAGPEAGV